MALDEHVPIIKALLWCIWTGYIINPSKRFLNDNCLQTADIRAWQQRAPSRHALWDTVTQEWIIEDSGSLKSFAAIFIIRMLEYNYYHAIHEMRMVYSEAYPNDQNPFYLDIVIAMLGLLTIDASEPGCFEYDCYLLGDALRHRSTLDDYELDLLGAEYYYTLAIAPVPGAPPEHEDIRNSAKDGLVQCKLMLATRAFSAYQSGDKSIDQAMNRIDAFLDMPDTFPKSQSDVCNLQGMLAFLHWSRWVQSMRISDLRAALPLARQATQILTAIMDWLILLANILQNLHWRDGSTDAFHEGIQVVNQIESLEESNPETKGSSNYLRSDFYSKQFSLFHSQADIEIAVATARAGYTNGHHSCIDDNALSLCTALHVRGRHCARPEDLEEAMRLIDEHFESYDKMPSEEDRYRVRFASLRSTILSYREETLEEATKGHKRIVDCMDARDPNRSMQQWLLGRDYRQLGQLHRAQGLFVVAARGMNSRRPEYVRCLSDLGKTYQDLAAQSACERVIGAAGEALSSRGDTGFLWKKALTVGEDPCLDLINLSMSTFAQALLCPSGEMFVRAHAGKRASLSLYAFQQWKNCYKTAVATIKLFPGMTNRELSMQDSQSLLKGLTDVSSLAASAVLKMSCMPLRALRILESGRGVILKQFMDWKTDHTRLQDAHPEIYQQFIQLQNANQVHVDDNITLESSISEMLQTSSERIRLVQKMSDLRVQIMVCPTFTNLTSRSTTAISKIWRAQAI